MLPTIAAPLTDCPTAFPVKLNGVGVAKPVLLVKLPIPVVFAVYFGHFVCLTLIPAPVHKLIAFGIISESAKSVTDIRGTKVREEEVGTHDLAVRMCYRLLIRTVR